MKGINEVTTKIESEARKIAAELGRIADALEVLAIKSNPEFVPIEERRKRKREEGATADSVLPSGRK